MVRDQRFLVCTKGRMHGSVEDGSKKYLVRLKPLIAKAIWTVDTGNTWMGYVGEANEVYRSAIALLKNSKVRPENLDCMITQIESCFRNKTISLYKKCTVTNVSVYFSESRDGLVISDGGRETTVRCDGARGVSRWYGDWSVPLALYSFLRRREADLFFWVMSRRFHPSCFYEFFRDSYSSERWRASGT